MKIKYIITTILFLIPISTFAQSRDSLVVAGGCFWCVEAAFDKVPGVLDTESGYAGGDESQITYDQVSSGTTNHKEVLKITYDTATTNIESLLEAFWQNIDPFNPDGQFCDTGPQYASAIFYKNKAEKDAAEKSLEKVRLSSKKEIKTSILELKNYVKAEEYHQNYYQKNPNKYNAYKYACGRDKRLREIKTLQEIIFDEAVSSSK